MDTYTLIVSAMPSIISSLAVAGIYKIYHKVPSLETLRSGVCAILRNNIIQSCKTYIGIGEKPLYEVNNVSQMYEAYHALGGNGSVTSLYEMFSKLPIKIDDSRKRDSDADSRQVDKAG